MSRMSMKSVQVSCGSAGKWSVETAGDGPATLHDTQAEAVEAARASVAATGGHISVHSRTGRVKISFTLGRQAMETLNAVEGLTLSDRARGLFNDHDRRDLNSEERRSDLVATFARKKG